jgi:hypothetical protein
VNKLAGTDAGVELDKAKVLGVKVIDEIEMKKNFSAQTASLLHFNSCLALFKYDNSPFACGASCAIFDGHTAFRVYALGLSVEADASGVDGQVVVSYDRFWCSVSSIDGDVRVPKLQRSGSTLEHPISSRPSSSASTSPPASPAESAFRRPPTRSSHRRPSAAGRACGCVRRCRLRRPCRCSCPG